MLRPAPGMLHPCQVFAVAVAAGRRPGLLLTVVGETIAGRISSEMIVSPLSRTDWGCCAIFGHWAREGAVVRQRDEPAPAGGQNAAHAGAEHAPEGVHLERDLLHVILQLLHRLVRLLDTMVRSAQLYGPTNLELTVLDGGTMLMNAT